MKQNIFAIVAAVALVLGMGGCSKDDNSTTSSADVETMEKSLVGLWLDEYEYAGETEDYLPFSRVQLVVKVDADHTGYICLGAYDDESDYPLAVYGGPVDAGFKWQLKADGTIVLTDPDSGESISLVRTRGNGSGSYGEKMTDVSDANMTYLNGKVVVTNSDYSRELRWCTTKSLAKLLEKVANQTTGITLTPESEEGTCGSFTDSNGRSREGIVVMLNGQKYAIATSNETENPTFANEGRSYYTWVDAVTHYAAGRLDGAYTQPYVWRLPTESEVTALIKLQSSCRNTPCVRWWKIGASTLILPSPGYFFDNKYEDVNSRGYYWTSTPSGGILNNDQLDMYHYAQAMYIYDNEECYYNGWPLIMGFSVRLFVKLSAE